MKRPTDEILMAFADGELDGAEYASLRAYLQENEPARRKVRMFRWTAVVVRKATGDVNFELMPQRISELFHSHMSKPARHGFCWTRCLLNAAAVSVIFGGFAIWAGLILDLTGCQGLVVLSADMAPPPAVIVAYPRDPADVKSIGAVQTGASKLGTADAAKAHEAAVGIESMIAAGQRSTALEEVYRQPR